MVLLCMKAKGDLYQDHDKNKIKYFSKIISLSTHVPLYDLLHEKSVRNKDHIYIYIYISKEVCYNHCISKDSTIETPKDNYQVRNTSENERKPISLKYQNHGEKILNEERNIFLDS